MSGEKQKNKQKANPKVAKLRNTLTPRQSRFAEALMDRKVKSRTQAAILAGYSLRNARQSANQAFNQILSKGPEAMREAGLNLPVMIDKYLRPLLEAKETKLAQYEGQYTDFVVLDDNTTSLAATNMAFKLLGAYPPKDPVLAAKTTVDVIICDMPETKYDKEPIDVRPTVSRHGRKSLMPDQQKRQQNRSVMGENAIRVPKTGPTQAQPEGLVANRLWIWRGERLVVKKRKA